MKHIGVHCNAEYFSEHSVDINSLENLRQDMKLFKKTKATIKRQCETPDILETYE